MKKQTLAILCGFILIGLLSGCAVHKTYGPYEGKVVDSETGQPIEGAALHMVFYTQTGNPGGSSSIYAGDKEVVTDSEGKFNLSQSLWTFRPLHFWGEPPLVCLFKPGYGTFPRHQQANIASPKGLEQIPEGQFTTIELPPLKTSKERWENLSKVYIGVMDSNKYQSKVYKLKEEEIHIIEEMRGQRN